MEKTDLRKFFIDTMDGVLTSDELNTQGKNFQTNIPAVKIQSLPNHRMWFM